MATSSQSHGTSRGGASRGESAGPAHGGICTFLLGDRQYGLDVALVGEVVSVAEVAPVPMAHGAVRGIFNLRGTPVALLDLGEVLALEGDRIKDHRTALVVRRDDLVVGFVIDRMEAVVAEGRGVFTDATAEDHASVRGFLELDDAGGVVTVIDPAALLERIEATRFLKTED